MKAVVLVQRSAKSRSSGFKNFAPPVAYWYFCLVLPAAFTEPDVLLLAEPCPHSPVVS